MNKALIEEVKAILSSKDLKESEEQPAKEVLEVFNANSLLDDAKERDVPASVKDQARAIEKSKGKMKLRRGGAKTKAGVAYATAWKAYKAKNPGSRHFKK